MLKNIIIMNDITSLPVFTASGSYFHIGVEIGKYFKDRIHAGFQQSKIIQERLEWDRKCPEQLTKAVEMTKTKFPEYIEEMRGIAQGCNLPERKIFVVNFMHLPPVADCSTTMIWDKKNQKAAIIHNEDHEWGLGYNSYLVQIKYPNKTQLLAHCYPGVIPGLSFAFNNFGICMTCNYVPDPAPMVGIPRVIIGRWILDAKNLEKAKHRAVAITPRAGGVNFNLGWGSKKGAQLANVELTAVQAHFTEIPEKIFHANHYIALPFRDFIIPEGFEIRSTARQEQGEKLLNMISPTIKEALELMYDPIIYFKPQTLPTGEKFLTVCTLVFDVDEHVTLKLYKKPQSIQQPFQVYSSKLFQN
jgi:predicted choloylglycine hydrolase